MLNQEDIDAVNKGLDHCVLHSDLSLQCLKCKGYYRPNIATGNGIEIWAMQGLAWGFAKEHADCEVDDD